MWWTEITGWLEFFTLQPGRRLHVVAVCNALIAQQQVAVFCDDVVGPTVFRLRPRA